MDYLLIITIHGQCEMPEDLLVVKNTHSVGVFCSLSLRSMNGDDMVESVC